ALGATGRNQGLAMQVVDHLHVDVVHRTVHVQPRTFGRALQLLANPVMHPLPGRILSWSAQHISVLSRQSLVVSETPRKTAQRKSITSQTPLQFELPDDSR